MRLLVGLIFSLSLSLNLHAQEQADSTAVHSVKKAVIYSAVLPGLGQVYNHQAMPKGKKKAFWKVPLIYGALGASGYFLISNQQLKNELKSEYISRTENGLYSDKWIQYDDQAILTLYNQHLNFRDLSILAVTGVYLLQVVDAGVEAHFVDFDISEDLSLHIRPVLYSRKTAGIGLSLKFR